jgi:hypothetical protein
MTTRMKTVDTLREELEAALAADDVPTLGTTAAELRSQLRLYRTTNGDVRAVETIDGFRRVLNQALADRLSIDLDGAQRAKIALPLDYPRFADELANDEARFADLARRTEGFVWRTAADAPIETGEEGD